MIQSTNLYRHFDSNGSLLYVGISLSAVQRLGQHKAGSEWFNKICKVEIETFDTRQEALKAEKNAIQHEQPKYNINGRKKPIPANNTKLLMIKDAYDQLMALIPNEYNGKLALKLEEAAAELGITKDEIKLLYNEGQINLVRLSPRCWRVPARELNRLKKYGVYSREPKVD